jgi:hypothetical protein
MCVVCAGCRAWGVGWVGVGGLLFILSIVLLFAWLISACYVGECGSFAVLHSSDPLIIHRDLKSLNLLVDESWTVKVRIASSTCTPIACSCEHLFLDNLFPVGTVNVRGHFSTSAPCSQCTPVALWL